MTADTVGGVWTYAIELTRALGGRMDHVDFVLATMGALPSASQRAEVPDNVRLVPSEYRLEWMDDPWPDLARAGAWLLDIEAAEAPDVVHLNGYAHGALPFRAPKLVVGHSCVMTWWSAVRNEDAPPSWNEYREQVARGLRACDLVVAPTAWMLGALDERYAFDTPTRLIYNGRSDEQPTTGERPRTTVFSAGRLWDEAKNL